ncbi:MAG: hypothetical protein AAF573_22445 [Bacteroidota bacterium]
MAKKDNNSAANGTSLGEISTIRDILMGQHINDFESRFKSLSAQLSALEEKMTKKIKELDANAKASRKDLSSDTAARFGQLEEKTDNRLAQLEQALQDGLTDLRNALEESSLNDKEKIGQLLMDAGRSLMK